MREIDPEVLTFDGFTIERVVCGPCGSTFRASLSDHLAAVHPNAFFSIDVDPKARVATVRVPARPIGFFNKFGG